jgi:SPASM domain peptide maturase of grasp-with-spasm system
MKNKYFKFYASCIPVKGAKRGIIYDFRRGSIYYIPNTILEILEEYSAKMVSDLFNYYESQIELLQKYLDFLLENELIFFTDDLIKFPDINKKFIKPFEVDIVLLEIDNFDPIKIDLFQSQKLSLIGCSELVIISHNNSINSLSEILLMLDKSRIKTVTFFVDYKYFILETLNELSLKYLRLREIVIYNCPKKSVNRSTNNISFTSENIENILTNKVSKTDDFVLTIDAYLESQNHNLFYNRRIYIDNDNNIKHSIDGLNKYPITENQNLLDIIIKNEFKKLWSINKNRIEVCKDCEFRYVCPDNRIPILKEKNLYYHLTSCNYNPYTNKWK